jgi:glucose/arabinose dehydrogenase
MEPVRLGALILVSTLLALGLAAPPAAAQGVALRPVVESGLTRPVFVTHAGDGSGRLFVLEQRGLVRIIGPGGRLRDQPFLDIEDRVLSGGERGLLGLAFAPDYARSGRFFVYYTRRPDGAATLAEYRVSANANRAARRERVLLTIPQPFGNHNAGMIAFGPGGHLFIATGDGGSQGDPQNNAQNVDNLLGAVLRIGVGPRRNPYAIPRNNPFARGGGRPEIFAWGLRNPWRFSFDRETGDLWLADVGEARVEEINLIRRGRNYGWRIMEGSLCFSPREGCDRRGLELPVHEYLHTGGRCSITGGYVYRGQAIPALRGSYLFGDYCSGEIFAFRDASRRLLLDTSLAISSFGEDEAGEVYVVGLGGTISRIVPAR